MEALLTTSREMIADELCLEIRKRYGSKRDIQIEVSEDNGVAPYFIPDNKMTIYIVDIEAVDTDILNNGKSIFLHN